MTDERVDALIRQLDIAATPDPAFITSSLATLGPRARVARIQDVSRIGRMRRDLRLALASRFGSTVRQPIAIVGLVVLLLLAAVAVTIVIAGTLNRSVPLGNGLLIITIRGDLRAIDVDTEASRPIGPSGQNARHVSRSPDGRLVAYWNVAPGGETLTFMGIDGGGLRPVSEERAVTWGGCIDTWSPDSRYLASEVTVGGTNRILVADSATATGRLLTPDGMVAHCPLWSPDGRWIAFTQERKSGPAVLAIIRSDGTGLHSVSGDLGGADVAGPNTWSNDGTWIYFTTGGAEGSIWRANVALAASTRLTDRPGFATAVASSPNGSLISWIVSVPTSVGWDLWVANSDGSHPRRLLENAMNLGWSADSKYILTWWRPSDRPSGIAVASPDGSEVRVVVPSDQACIDPDRICDIGWGQPRP
jgi:Tol biopolymer transport system component